MKMSKQLHAKPSVQN